MIALTIVLIAMVVITIAFYYSNDITERIIFILISAMTIGIIFGFVNHKIEDSREKRVAYEIEQQRNLAKEVFGTDQGFNEAWRPQWAR